MPHCQKEFSKPPVSAKQKKAQQQAKKESEKNKKSKRTQEDEAADAEARAAEEEEKDPAEREAELARAAEAEKKEADAKKLKEAKAKGTEAFRKNNMVDALQYYSECIELAPDDYIHWSNRAAVNTTLGNFEEAVSDATKCTELNPEFVKGWARIGRANFAWDKLDAAEAAFQHGLTLDPESTLCKDGLSDVEKAKEEEKSILDVLVKELEGLELSQLQVRALEQGLNKEKVEEGLADSEDPKATLVSLMTAHKYLVDLIKEELRGLDAVQLRERAVQEDLGEEAVEKAANSDDSMTALTSILVNYLSNDLLFAATELTQEVAEENAESDDDDAEEGDIDFEIVEMDESDMQLAEGHVFLAGAYIDPTYGELVLPNGSRLGNRALQKFYRQKARPVNERQLAFSHLDPMSRLNAKLANRHRTGLISKSAQIGTKSSIATQALFKQNQADNKAMRAIVHHWGAGGGGSHYHLCGGKQYNKGNKVKGVMLRHSVQGAKLQAARNKSNRGNKSVAVLQ